MSSDCTHPDHSCVNTQSSLVFQLPDFRTEETSGRCSSEFGHKLSQGFAYIASIGPLLRDWVFLWQTMASHLGEGQAAEPQ